MIYVFSSTILQSGGIPGTLSLNFVQKTSIKTRDTCGILAGQNNLSL